MTRAARTYVSVTGRSLLGNTLTWLQELVTEFGDDVVAESLEEHSLDVPADKLLGKVRDTLARERLIERKMVPHRELSKGELMAWVRGEWVPPEFPVIFDAIRFRLDAGEWNEITAWTVRGHRPEAVSP
jgi:hypothetical protein